MATVQETPVPIAFTCPQIVSRIDVLDGQPIFTGGRRAAYTILTDLSSGDVTLNELSDRYELARSTVRAAITALADACLPRATSDAPKPVNTDAELEAILVRIPDACRLRVREGGAVEDKLKSLALSVAEAINRHSELQTAVQHVLEYCTISATATRRLQTALGASTQPRTTPPVPVAKADKPDQFDRFNTLRASSAVAGTGHSHQAVIQCVTSLKQFGQTVCGDPAGLAAYEDNLDILLQAVRLPVTQKALELLDYVVQEHGPHDASPWARQVIAMAGQLRDAIFPVPAVVPCVECGVTPVNQGGSTWQHNCSKSGQFAGTAQRWNEVQQALTRLRERPASP